MYFQKLYTDIFNRPGEPGEVSMLKEVTHEYPYFSLAHFFLLKHAIEKGDEVNNIASKTALHFNNPFLLNEQLHKAPLQSNGSENTAGHFEEINKGETGILRDEDIIPDVVDLRAEEMVPVVEYPTEEKIVAEEDDVNHVETKHLVEQENETETLPVVEQAFQKNTPTVPEQIEPAPTDDQPVSYVDTDEELNRAIPSEAVPVVTPFLGANTPGTGTINKDDEAPLFEPLSASDYFASQGIKLTEEHTPTDRVGKQLKSFTEWLKTMKKVHEHKTVTGDVPVDIAVQNLAEKSNREEEILTEAMAEVYSQQGKTNKAKEIYEKLSLLNPSKSAYFAAKLEQIK